MLKFTLIITFLLSVLTAQVTAPFELELKTRIVNGEQLCYLATQLGMNPHLIISKHIEENCSGRDNQHILEDVLEAFIGALYLDSHDYQLIQTFVFNLIECHLDLPEIILNDTNYKDQILRYFQHNFKLYPTYRHIDKADTDTEFQCELVKEDQVICLGKGSCTNIPEIFLSLFNSSILFKISFSLTFSGYFIISEFIPTSKALFSLFFTYILLGA